MATPLEIPPFGGMRPGPRAHLREECERLQKLHFDRIELKPLSPTIGAVILGVDLGRLDDATFEEIRRAWLAYKVVFFRDQRITAQQQMDFARRFGELEEHPFLAANAEHRQIVEFAKDEDVRGYENLWHSDVSWREIPSLGSVLRAITVPPHGGDTLFCDMGAAYTGLDESLRERIEGRWAIHDFTQSFGLGMKPEELAAKRKEFPPARHPMVRTHADTGRKILYVNSIFTSHVEGMDRAESDLLIDLLLRQVTVPEYQCRFRWEPDSVAFWDNRAVQHYASSDYWPERRVMERVTVIGERPF